MSIDPENTKGEPESGDVPSGHSSEVRDTFTPEQRRIAERAADLVLGPSANLSTRMRNVVEGGKQPFDLSEYEEVVEHPNCRELFFDDRLLIGGLYRSQEIGEDAFWNLSQGEKLQAQKDLEGGGLVGAWRNTPGAMAALKKADPRHESCEDEFCRLLKQKHGRSSTFRVFGAFDVHGKLCGMAGGFFQPRKRKKLNRHVDEVRAFFLQKNPREHFYPDPGSGASQAISRISQCAEHVAEFYIMISGRRGAGTVAIDHMFQQLDKEEIAIKHWYLLRFGTLTTVHDDPERIYRVGDGDNAASKKYFNKRGFDTCGQCDMWWDEQEGAEVRRHQQLAAREAHGVVIVVHPTWKVMEATDEEFRKGNCLELAEIKRRADVARRAG